VLLEPKKGTQGREMNCKIRIAAALALTGLLTAATPLTAFAGSPLLSGYGGPGAGEQSIVGSTLLNAPHGGGGSGGSPGTGGSAGTSNGPGASTSGGTTSNGQGVGLTGAAGSAGSSTSTDAGNAGRASRSGPSSGTQVNRANAYVYPSSLSSTPADTPALGISSGDVFPLIGMIATLALIGAITLRLARLQR
jgi:hypothetical protein